MNKEQANIPRFYLCLIENRKFLGRLLDFTSHARLQGPCGDSMEFYLVIDQNKIKAVKCFTDGCEPTKACAVLAASLVFGKSIEEALKISAGDLIERMPDLPESHRHCSILAVSTLYRAIAEYLLMH
ncbi:MAG TPA: iron-sulfur cluster assembly scaffold protein [Candidatus Omnitrophota bacterium]|nr:iron-sulfur cluster assembly scaffold protein [Candidatus Omnitrophota bacterium]HPN56336.1 iron-sulfur cluster assembly scaffold protein [Candidatus Omnitrophota bacterium]